MQQEGCIPNIVTYNTLIDVYGKLGQWQEALGVLETLRMEVSRRGQETRPQAALCPKLCRRSWPQTFPGLCTEAGGVCPRLMQPR